MGVLGLNLDGLSSFLRDSRYEQDTIEDIISNLRIDPETDNNDQGDESSDYAELESNNALTTCSNDQSYDNYGS